MSIKLFVSCLHGLESLLVDELNELGISDARAGFCGVYVTPASHLVIYTINYRSRLAARVLLPLRQFRCHDRHDLYRQAQQIDWAPYIPRGKTIAIDANVTHPRLRHSLFAAQVVKDAICDQLRNKRNERPSVQVRNPDVQLHLFIDQKKAVLSLDTSGAPLHHRGYRQAQTTAPLQETLAAAMLRLAGYDGSQTLVDPCCGGGTILTEAALIASKTPPGFCRKRWGLQLLPGFDRKLWHKVQKYTPSEPKTHSIIGIDQSREALGAARANRRAIGCPGLIKLHEADCRDVPLPEGALLVSNPPHDRRLKGSFAQLYQDLGDWLQQHRGVILAGSKEQTRAIKGAQSIGVRNGGKPCYLVLSKAHSPT